MIIMIIAELSGRRKQSSTVLGGEGQSLGTKPRFNTSLDLKNSSIVGYFKKINAFLVYSILCFHKTVHNKWCLDKTVHEKIENGLERGFSELSETTSLNN